jgi:hypothetical protein
MGLLRIAWWVDRRREKTRSDGEQRVAGDRQSARF